MNAIMRKRTAKPFPSLGQIAQIDPRLAATLLYGGAFAPTGDVLNTIRNATGGWEVLNLSARFTETTAEKTIPMVLPEVAEVDVWVRDIRVSVRRPNYFPGNPLRDIANAAYSMNPDINVTLGFRTWCDFDISEFPIPLGNLETEFECVCPVGIVLTCGASIVGSVTNIRALVDPDEIPTLVDISIHVTRLPKSGCYQQLSIQDALAILDKKGICPG